jgi:hypothetical protein
MTDPVGLVSRLLNSDPRVNKVLRPIVMDIVLTIGWEPERCEERTREEDVCQMI